MTSLHESCIMDPLWLGDNTSVCVCEGGSGAEWGGGRVADEGFISVDVCPYLQKNK